MTMMAFFSLFPEEAERECRTVTPFGNSELPKRTFAFVEAYCVIPNCDCRRVMINVIDTERHEQVATINYAFEPPKPPFDDERRLFLDPLNPQSSLSSAFLGVFDEVIGRDEAYRRRLVRHYTMWKRVIDDPSHPAHRKIRASKPGFGIFPPQRPARRVGPKLGPNDPCPCGSGRKYKKCCRG